MYSCGFEYNGEGEDEEEEAIEFVPLANREIGEPSRRVYRRRNERLLSMNPKIAGLGGDCNFEGKNIVNGLALLLFRKPLLKASKSITMVVTFVSEKNFPSSLKTTILHDESSIMLSILN